MPESSYRLSALLTFVLASIGCADAERASDGETLPERVHGSARTLDGEWIPLTCSERLPVSYRLLDASALELSVAGQKHVLRQHISASGARYLGEGVEFWSKGRESLLWIGELRYQCSAPEPAT